MIKEKLLFQASPRLFLLGLLLSLTIKVFGQSSATIDELKFMSGHWKKVSYNMLTEQVFLPPVAGTITGIQRRSRNDSTLVTFFFIIQETKDNLVMRFKHFENDYTTYEDRNNTGPRTFKMIEITSTSVIFEERAPTGSLFLRYRLIENDRLAISVGTLVEIQSNSVSESIYERF